MLDLKKALENRIDLQKNCHNRRVQIDIDQLVQSVQNRADLRVELQTLRETQNAVAKMMKCSKSPTDRDELIAKGRKVKDQTAALAQKERQIEMQIEELALQLPNWSHPDSPLGQEGMGKTIKSWGVPPRFTHPVFTHQELGKRHGLLDFEAGTAVTGSKFVFLRNRAVLIEQALIQIVLKVLSSRGFSLYTTPDLARKEIVEGLGFHPRGKESQIYSLQDSDLCLIGTSEITLGGMLRDRLFEQTELPLKLAGLSHCFRTEAGAHGKDSKGLYRLHQFTKVEMFAAVSQDQSERCLDHLVNIQEEILQLLNLPYRIVDIPTGDLGGPAYRKFDIEVWMPGRGESGEFGEVTSASNCTDFQSRRLKIRHRKDGKNELIHTLNGTAIATSRILLALLENGQQKDGTVTLPAKLAELCGFSHIA